MKRKMHRFVFSFVMSAFVLVSSQQGNVYAAGSYADDTDSGAQTENSAYGMIRRSLNMSEPGVDYPENEAIFYLGFDPEEKLYTKACEIAARYNGVLAAYDYGAGLIRLPASAEDARKNAAAYAASVYGEEADVWLSGKDYAGVTVAEAVEDSLQDDDIPVIEPNYRAHVMETADAFSAPASPLQKPDDPYLDQSSEDDFQYFHHMLRSDLVWKNLGTGSADIKVAVIDTGVTTKHEDLPNVQQISFYNSSKKTNREWRRDDTASFDRPGDGWGDDWGDDWPGYGDDWGDDWPGYGDDWGDDWPGYSDNRTYPLEPDFSTHGTHVAGIIGAAAGNGKGGAGIAPGVTILSYNVNASREDYMDDYAIVAAITNCIKDGADIINMSLGAPEYLESEKNALADAYKAGITIFAAQGNDSSDMLSYPACYDEVIGVASVGESGALSDFSCFGASCDIAAPGSCIVSTVVPGLPGDEDDDGSAEYRSMYGSMSGTSMACPVAAGAAALYMSIYGNPGPEKMRSLMKEKAIKTPLTDLGIVDAAALTGINRDSAGADSSGNRLSICVGGSYTYDPDKDPQMAVGSSMKLQAVLDGRVLENSAVNWSIVSDDRDSNLKPKVYSKKYVKIAKTGKLTVKSNVMRYRQNRRSDASVLVRAELADGSGVLCEERFVLVGKAGKPSKIKEWSLISSEDQETIENTSKSKVIRLDKDTFAEVSFKTKKVSEIWVVTSSDPAVAGGMLYNIEDIKGGAKYYIDIYGGTKSGSTTITARSIDGSGRSVKWKVTN
ncbi:MAG: S8 family serine peptidase [Lachnospiraceae bacterium]|nr:S8 family serine peptidase [Lachnospiraceae bacterium]